MIENSQTNADHGVKAVDDLKEIFNSINESVEKTTQLIGELSDSTVQQSNGIEQINSAVQQMNQITQQNAASSEESASASQQMASQSQQLQSVVDDLSLIVFGNNRSTSSLTLKESKATNQDRTPVATNTVFNKPKELSNVA